MRGAKMILVPVDFQAASLEALALAHELAEKLGFEIRLMHVYSMPVVAYPGFDPIVTPSVAAEVGVVAKKSLERLALEHGGLRTILWEGDAATEILKAIVELTPALVVMGTHGRVGLSHLFVGSVAEKIVRGSPAPVLTVHAKPKP